MNKFLVMYTGTDNNTSKKGLVTKHVDYIKSLYKNKIIAFVAALKGKQDAVLIL